MLPPPAAKKQLNAETIMKKIKIAESTSVKLTSCKSHQPPGRGGGICCTGQETAVYLFMIDWKQTQVQRGGSKSNTEKEEWSMLHFRKKYGSPFLPKKKSKYCFGILTVNLLR